MLWKFRKFIVSDFINNITGTADRGLIKQDFFLPLKPFCHGRVESRRGLPSANIILDVLKSFDCSRKKSVSFVVTVWFRNEECIPITIVDTRGLNWVRTLVSCPLPALLLIAKGRASSCKLFLEPTSPNISSSSFHALPCIF